MKILHIGKYYAPFSGGIENTMRDLMSTQNSCGHQVSAVVHQHSASEKSAHEVDNGMSIYRMSIQSIVLFVPISVFAYFWLRKALNKENPEILHLHKPNATCFWLLFLPSARKLPWIVHWHSDVIGERPDRRVKILYPFYRVFEQWLLRRAAKVIVTSPNYLMSSTPLTKWRDKCEIVPLGVNIRSDASASNDVEEEKKSSELQVLCIGRLTYYKGHKYLIESISKAKEEGIVIHLDLVGDGDLKSICEQQVNDLNVQELVTFHGSVDQNCLNQLMARSHVVCLPSIERTEAFGLVLLEAMRAKKPCIVTNVPGSGLSFVVDHLKTGLVVEHSNAEALAEAFIHCTCHPHHLKDWGDSGYQKVETQFSLESIAKQIDKIYQEVLADT